MQSHGSQPATVDIRRFLSKAFNDEELETLCSDHFPPVYNDFTTGMTKSRKIQLLLDYCQRYDVIHNLLAAIQKARPEQYEKPFPQTPQVQVPPEASKPQRDPRQVFISHAHEDADFAHQLASDLRQHDWQVWIAPDSIQAGEKWVQAINRGLQESGVFILVLTPAAVKSRWVEDETNVAIDFDHQGQLRFLPLDVERCEVPPLWTTYQHISFRDRPMEGLTKLLGELEQGWQEREAREKAAQEQAETETQAAEPKAKPSAQKADAERKPGRRGRKAREKTAKAEAERQTQLPTQKAEAELLVLAEIVKVGRNAQALNTKKLGTLNEKLDQWVQTCNETILRELRAAFRSLEDIVSTSHGEGSVQLPNKIPDSFLASTSLKPELKTGKILNADIIALSYYGLAFISVVGDHPQTAERYVLRMFESGSRLARKELAPGIFEAWFKPKCQGCYAAHEARLRAKVGVGDYVEQGGRGVLAALAVAGAVVTYSAHLGAAGMGKVAEKVWQDGAEGKEWRSKGQIDELLEVELDHRCSEIAKELLSKSKD